MSTPAAKVQFRLSDGRSGSAVDPRVITEYAKANGLTVEWGESGPAAGIRRYPAPESGIPDFIAYKPPPEVGAGEAFARGAAESVTLGTAPYAAGAVNMLKAAATRPGDAPVQQPTQPQGPAIARAGIGTPEVKPELMQAFEEGAQNYRERTVAGEEQNPGAAMAGRFTGGAAVGLAVPQLRAAQGAGVVGKALAAAGNVGADAALSGVAGYAESGGDPEAAKRAALFGAGASGVLRGGAAAPGALLRGGRDVALGAARLRGTVEAGDVSEEIRSFLSEKPTGQRTVGAEARRAATEGADTDAAARAMYGDLRKMDTARDAVMSESKARLKPGKLTPLFEQDGITDPVAAYVNASPYVDQVVELAQKLKTGRVKGMGSGSNALARIDKAAEAFRQRINAAPQEGAEGVASVYAALDQFKREVAKAAKAAGSGANRDDEVSHELAQAYAPLMRMLEDPEAWGPAATKFQAEVNAAWHDTIPALSEYGRRFQSGSAVEQSAGNWAEEYRPTGSENVSSFVNSAGSAGAIDAEKALRSYIEKSPKLLDTLSENYEVGPGAQSQLSEAKEAAKRVGGTLDQTLTSADATRRLRGIREAAPRAMGIPLTSPADMIGAVGKAEALAERMKLPQADAAVRKAGGVGSRATGVATATQYTPDERQQAVMAAAASQPEKLGRYGQMLNVALQKGKDHFVSQHSVLYQTNPEYQQLVDELAQEGKR